MSLEEEVASARTEIVSDGYEMSVGEIMNLYRDKELKIDPAFQLSVVRTFGATCGVD